MPLDQISAYMDYSTLPEYNNLPLVDINYHFENGLVTFSSHSISGVYSGKSKSAEHKANRLDYRIGRSDLFIKGDVVSFHCDFDVNCATDQLTGTITVAQALPVSVCLGSNTTGDKVKLAPGQLQLKFKLSIADRAESGNTSRLDNDLMPPTGLVEA